MPKRIKSQYRQRQALNSKLKKLIETGIYTPKSTELTKSRVSTINRLWNLNKENLDKTKTLFVKIPKSEKFRADSILKKAKGLKLNTTSTGIFIHKQGQRRATISFNYKSHESEIILRGKVKNGPRAGKKIETRIPLVSIDQIGDLENLIRKSADGFGKLKSNEALQFRVITDDWEGISHRPFINSNELIKYLKTNYDKTPVDRIMFYRHIVVEKTTIEKWKRDYKATRKVKTKKRKMNKQGRNI